ncbi:MAG: hypothetical protein Q9184_006754 [Pyrenodesmia sp. 2 TL-2023]
MASNEETLQLTTEVTEKEDRPLKRKVDRQAQKIHELTAQISKLEAEAEKQAEELGSLQDERDDARDETKQALHYLDRWKRYVAHVEGLKRTEIKRLTEALKVSQKEVAQLRAESRLREQTAQTGGKKLCDALTADFHARHSEDAALKSLATLFKDTGIYQAPAPDQRPSPSVAALLLVKLPPPPGCDQDPSPTVAAVPLIELPPPPSSDSSDSYSQGPSPTPSKTTPTRLHYTIQELKSCNPVTNTERTHGTEVAAAVWRSHPSHHNRTNENCPPTRPLPASRLRLPIGTPPRLSFVDILRGPCPRPA